jgi:competence ComEA-like helix-hairpin-helix protein
VQAEVEASFEPAEAVPAEPEMKAEELLAAVTEPTLFEEEAELFPPVEMAAEPSQRSDETVPGWLVSDFTQPTAPSEVEETAPAEVQPVPMLDLNQASLSDLEDLPGIGFILAQAIVNYRQEHGDFSSIEQLDQVPGIGSERIDELKNWVEVTPALPRYEEIAVGPGLGEEQIFAQAQTALSLGDLPAANASFSTLVHKQVFLTQIIVALKQALNQHPNDLFTWRTLGDAHVRNDQLQEALDAYVKAEELLS